MQDPRGPDPSIGRHLVPARLLAEPSSLTDEDRGHLRGCPRCRVDARLLRRAADEPPAQLPGLGEARRALSEQRTTLGGTMRRVLSDTAGTLSGRSSEGPAGSDPSADPDRYAIDAWLGVGTSGIVYAATDRVTGVPVALKLLFPGRADRPGFREGWLALKGLEHPNLVRRWALVDRGSEVCCVFEYVDGLPLTEWVRSGSATPGRLRGAMWQLACGLSVLHEAGRIHGRIKPTNVLVDRTGRLVLLDPLVADVGAATGEPALAAPEVVAGSAPGPAADWYQVGLLLFRCLVPGHPPPPPGEAAAALRGAAVDVPELAGLCADLLQPDPDLRPEAAACLRTLGSVDPLRQRPELLDEGRIALGGMGEVRRVRDPVLGRAMAMKIASPRIQADEEQLHRFVEEAQVTAQLQHPGVVPVHELGRLPDGRVFFTMKEIRGATLGQRIDSVHASSGPDGWGADPAGWSLRRLVDALWRACQTVAYAHSRGVLHRDLKPSNIMTGDYGEVLVLDWGVARLRGGLDLVARAGDRTPLRTVRNRDPRLLSGVGSVAGTAPWMAPEQASGDPALPGPWSDVYGAGAVLYTALTGRAPYKGGWLETLAQLVDGPPPAPSARADATGGPIPGGLEAICLRAMARDPAERYADAGELADAVQGWLERAPGCLEDRS